MKKIGEITSFVFFKSIILATKNICFYYHMTIVSTIEFISHSDGQCPIMSLPARDKGNR